jgi:hypothetical protein
MHDKLDDVFARRHLRIGAGQRDLLARILGDIECLTVSDDEEHTRHGGAIIVDEPPRLLQVDAFCRSLPPSTIVIIPRSENPAYDFLKSKLCRHGLIGASAPDSPHQIWWGGPKPVKPANTCQSILQAHLVSCVRRDSPEEETAIMFEKSLTALNFSHSIKRLEFYVAFEHEPGVRSQSLLEAWDKTEKPLIWLDPHSAGNPPAVSIDLSNVDFAATLTPNGTFSTNFLYFGRSQVALELLKAWNNLCQEFQTLPADHLLDAAWSLVTSQRALVTLWLDPCGGPAVKHSGEIAPDRASTDDAPQQTFGNQAQREARKAGRSAAPEPQCILNSRFGGRGPLTLIILSQFATARETADTMHSAVDAFSRFDGGFASLGIVICRNETEIEETIQKIGDGFYLCARSGVFLEDDIFGSLYEKTQDHELGYAMHRNCGHRQTRTGNNIAVTRSQVMFLNSIHSNNTGRTRSDRRPVLTVVSQ